MHTQPTTNSDLAAAARDLVIHEQSASISLLQRHLRVGYSYAHSLMDALERAGIVTPPSASGMRDLADAYRVGLPAFREWALSEFAGCDGGDPFAGTWVLGFEHGASLAEGVGEAVVDDGYPISRQRGYRYNRQVFKLLSAIEGGQVSDWLAFAESKQPFVEGARGYFKGNLYPYPCVDNETWTDTARDATGFTSKERYRAWCRNHRFAQLERWIERADPRMNIACGIGYRQDFVSVAFQRAPVEVQEHRLEIRGRIARFYTAVHRGRLLVVLPHLSGSPLLAANATLQALGAQIAALKHQASASPDALAGASTESA